eukprot:CAMPEP_0172322940 /NCGR_PEP_ID=MMETSP1058-20130122/47369_1 /TAXON_ID=83371 /ORGANISM="Detonula confervacea, Strain CCMP 353" /LENGTH=314 /DNA_ID=CAMNT_0013038813 /DNA_START=69 /DNA_END=1013 /DNA_ORIENTATION=+
MAANNDENVAMLMSMGFDRDQAAQALSDCGSLERAIDSLLSGSVVGGGVNSNQYDDVTNAAAQSNGDERAVHSEMSQYSDSLGRSACTSIALTMACNLLNMATINPEGVIDSSFLSNSILEGIKMYNDLSSSNSNGVEHSSIEELLSACHSADSNNSTAKQIISSLKQFNFSPRQGILSNSSDNPMGLEAVLSQCQADATDSESYIAVVITKPPETVLVLLPPRGHSSSTYILLDSHPRPQQLSPHHPSGSYALFHSTLSSLVASIKQIFPVTELGSDVPEMMAMMYNSFDVYPFQYQCLQSTATAPATAATNK